MSATETQVRLIRGADLGRGSLATADMKARIAALRREGVDIVDALWRRHVNAITGAGYVYDHTDRPNDPSIPGRW